MAGAIGLLFTSMHMTLLGALLALSPRALYGSGDVSCFGIPLTPIVDHQAGGSSCCWSEQRSISLAASSLLATMLNSGSPQASRRRG